VDNLEVDSVINLLGVNMKIDYKNNNGKMRLLWMV